MASNNSDISSDVAIIAMVGRFPKSDDLEMFWKNLEEGKECISFFSDQQLQEAGVPPKLLKNPKYVKAHGVLNEVDLFDSYLFEFIPAEAEIIDPQHRLFLQYSAKAIETAGYNPDTYPGLIGVYAGAAINTYLTNEIYPNIDPPNTWQQFQLMVANDKDYLSTRVSYKLNLKGPSYTIQTACSTSLVAVHQACQGLLSGECDMALAGGVTVKLPQITGYLYEDGQMFSPDGHIRPFDAGANGIVLGNGIGIIVLKMVKDAIADGDAIHAIIKGSATNNDGSFKASYFAPSKEGQAAVVTEAQLLGGIRAESISYLEAQGIGTNLGDPVEIAALTQAFRKTTLKKKFCGIGSVKSNVGHLDAAAGVAGLIKTVLMLKNKKLAPSINYKTPNPNIDFDNSPFYVTDKLVPWKSNGAPRRAGVSAFGIGGTNAHLILEEAPLLPRTGRSRGIQIITQSAKTAAALDEATDNLFDFLHQNPQSNLADVAFTLNLGRREYSHRRVVLIPETTKIIQPEDKNAAISNFLNQDSRSITFIYSGKVGKKLNLFSGLREERVFCEQVEACFEILQSDSEPRNIELFIFQYALTKLWISWGIKPQALICNGLSEYVAACVAGVISLQDSLSLLRSLSTRNLPEQNRTHRDKAINLKSPEISYTSSVTGIWITKEQATDPYYWFEQLPAAANKCHESLKKLRTDPTYFFVEISPETSSKPKHLLHTLGQLWLAGFPINWPGFYEHEKRYRIPLPTYPFEKRRCWIGHSKKSVREQNSEEVKGHLIKKQNFFSDPQRNNGELFHCLKQILEELLGISDEELPIREPLNRLGLNSLNVISLKSKLEQIFSVEIPISAIHPYQTIEDFESRLKKIVSCENTGSPTKIMRPSFHALEMAPTIVPNKANRYLSFPLNDVQESYLAGRKLGVGGDKMGCHIYLEMEFKDLYIYQLNKAWERLIRYHEMLHTVFLSDGRQRILEEIPAYKIKVADLRRKSESEQLVCLNAIRGEMSHKVYETDQWPLFEIRISVYSANGNKRRIHFSIDELILDAFSIDRLLQQWRKIYINPDVELPKLELSFRDYIVALKKFESSARYKMDLDYWTRKLENMPCGLALPLGMPTEHLNGGKKYFRTRLEMTLEKKPWLALKKKAEDDHVSPTALLLGVFTEVLRARVGDQAYSIILTFFNRMPIHPQIDQILGPFISTSIFVVEKKNGHSFNQQIRNSQKQLWEDLDHSTVSGLKVLRELKRNNKSSNSLFLPIVFTSLLNNKSMGDYESFFKEVSFSVTQTPQVYLDHQCREQNGQLRVSWDVCKDYFAPGLIDQLFFDYCHALELLASDSSSRGFELWFAEVRNSRFPCARSKIRNSDKKEEKGSLNRSKEIGLDELQLERFQKEGLKSFPLTDQQQVYAFGRSHYGGHTSSQMYMDFDTENLDVACLAEAWQKVLGMHDMLVTVIQPSGVQQILKKRPRYTINVTRFERGRSQCD